MKLSEMCRLFPHFSVAVLREANCSQPQVASKKSYKYAIFSIENRLLKLFLPDLWLATYRLNNKWTMVSIMFAKLLTLAFLTLLTTVNTSPLEVSKPTLLEGASTKTKLAKASLLASPDIFLVSVLKVRWSSNRRSAIYSLPVAQFLTLLCRQYRIQWHCYAEKKTQVSDRRIRSRLLRKAAKLSYLWN